MIQSGRKGGPLRGGSIELNLGECGGACQPVGWWCGEAKK